MFAMRPRLGVSARHRLDASRVAETARNLADDINSRLAGSSLAGLATELAGIADATEERGQQARRPILAIRILSALAIGLAVLGVWALVRHVHARWEFGTVGELFVALNAGFSLLVVLVGALGFFITLEARIKRREALQFIEELREFVHVIDVTQLYYTPDLYRTRHAFTANRLMIDETYLLYCTQMLAVISNLAPLYTRGATGDSILRAASEVEMLAIAITTKHLTKAEAVRGMQRESPKTGSSPEE